MLTLKRLAVYLLTFLLISSLVIWFVDWKWMDHYLVNEANKITSTKESLFKEILPVNLEKPDTKNAGADLTAFRKSIIQLLNTIAEKSKGQRGPKGVVLDFAFSSDTAELENLKAALIKLKQLKIPVYAAYKLNEKDESMDLDAIEFEDVDNQHATDIYNNYLSGMGDTNKPGIHRYHTSFYPDKNVFNYENDVILPAMFGDSVLIESLARTVAIELNDSKSMGHQPKRIGSIVPFRPDGEIKKRTFKFIADPAAATGTFQPPDGKSDSIDLNKNIVVVGDIANDVKNVGAGKEIPGPYVVMWAISDLLDDNKNLKLPLEKLWIIIGQILFFSFAVALVFALIFKYVKKLQTKPVVIAICSFLFCLLLFVLYGKLILSFNFVIPAGHTLVAMLVAAFLSWRFAYKFLVTGVAEGAQKYDIFISYSRSQSEWVEKNIYEPLAAFEKPNGEKLNIFYDKKSIGIGEAFTSKYMWAIVDSKYFLPVMSDDYYGKNHCRNEIDLAYKRQVEKLLEFKMVALSDKAVPAIFQQLNYLEKNRNPDFIIQIEKVFGVDGGKGKDTIFLQEKIISKANTLVNSDSGKEINMLAVSSEPPAGIVKTDSPGVIVPAVSIINAGSTKEESGKQDEKESVNQKLPEFDKKTEFSGGLENLLAEVIQELREDRKLWRDLALFNHEKIQSDKRTAAHIPANTNAELARLEALLSFTLDYLSRLTGKSSELLREEFEKKAAGSDRLSSAQEEDSKNNM